MAVTSEVSQSTYTGNGLTTSFATGFHFAKDTDVVVTLALSGLSEVPQIQGVHYALFGAGLDSDGTVSFMAAPPTGATVTITRAVSFTQPLSLRTQGSFSPALHEAAFDAATYRDQELNRRLTAVESTVSSTTQIVVAAGLPVWPEAPSQGIGLNNTATVRLANGALEASINGTTWRGFMPPKGEYTAHDIGIRPGKTATQNSDAFDNWHSGLAVGASCALTFEGTAINEYYNFARTIYINRPIRLRGAGPGGRGSYASYLTFPQNTTGIKILSASSTGRGDNAVIEDFNIVGLGYGGATSGYGIHMQAHATVRNCTVQNFGSHGVYIEGRSGDTPPTNANNWFLERVASTSNHGHGFYIDGADANAGVAIVCDGSSNDGYGFYDSSFLGNTFVGCHTDANVLGSYKADDVNARSLFLGCYVEGGQQLPDLAPSNSMWIGGLSEGGLKSGNGLIDGYWSRLLVHNWGGNNKSIQSYSVYGSQEQEGEQSIARHFHAAHPGQSLTMRFNPGDNFYEWYTASYGIPMQRIASPDNCYLETRYVPGASMVFPKQFYLGTKKFEGGTTAPVAGTYYVGDFILNQGATGPVGWKCTANGTMGTYSHLRTATANGSGTSTLSGPNDSIQVGDYLTINGVTTKVLAVSGTTLTTQDGIPTGSGLAINYAPAKFAAIGGSVGAAADSTATPGNVTQNTTTGRVAIPAGSSSVTVTNSNVTTSSIVTAALQSTDSNLTRILSIVCTAGSFTINCDNNAAATVKIGWVLA